jgi:hypothetical protein
MVGIEAEMCGKPLDLEASGGIVSRLVAVKIQPARPGKVRTR